MDPKAVIEALCGMDIQTCSSVITAVLETRPELAPGIVHFAVPDLTWAPAKALTERRSRGVVKGLNPHLGFGLIGSPELQIVFGNDVLVNSKQLGKFQVGQQVEFAVFLGKDNKPQAFDLQDPTAPVPRAGGMLLMQQQALVQHQLVATGGAGALLASSAPAIGVAVGAIAPPVQTLAATTMPGMLPGAPAGAGMPALPAPPPPAPPAAPPPPPAAARGAQAAPPGRKRQRQEDVKVLGQYQGVLKSFNAASGFGFVACDALRAMGHQTDVLVDKLEASGIEAGTHVRFTCVVNGSGALEALDLTPASGMPPAPAQTMPGVGATLPYSGVVTS